MNEPITVPYSLQEILKRIEDKIDTNQKEIKQEIKDVRQEIKGVNTKLEKLNTVEVELAEVKTDLKGINKRLDSQEFLNRSVAVGFILAFVSGFIKLFFPNLLPH
ncbi:hypothetical protein [Cyanothece sp. BG0011]|uniref:hypothetical protein n=1 Tax=Cyanothece sp. BG0011 TaxID=2082950 RepID=UPI000D1EBFF3|nr:hypothetical protein [Cyanothece sp. BG0011]